MLSTWEVYRRCDSRAHWAFLHDGQAFYLVTAATCTCDALNPQVGVTHLLEMQCSAVLHESLEPYFAGYQYVLGSRTVCLSAYEG